MTFSELLFLALSCQIPPKGSQVVPAEFCSPDSRSVEVLVSLNSGQSFISSPVTIYATACASINHSV